jgi:LytS/YehU family sensor histidine kinase
VNLQEEIDLLKLYIELESLRFTGTFDLDFSVSENVDTFNIDIPSMLFQPYVENAIIHGFQNLDRKGKLSVSFFMEEDHLIGIVEDNGIGRKNSAALKDSSDKEHASRGMELIAERIAVINKMENVRIEVEIKDKVAADGESLGTKVTIRIPV